MIGVTGNEFFGRRIEKSFNNENKVKFFYVSLRDWKFKNKIKNIEIIHYIGSPTVTMTGAISLLRSKMFGKKTIVHWIGSDSWMATNNLKSKILTKIFKNQVSIHISIEKKVAERIDQLGISSTVHRLPVATHYNVEPLPDKKQIIVYAPDNAEYYWKTFNGTLIQKIVKEFKEINFVILRNSGKHFKDCSNVECFEWVENMEELYKKSLAVIRISTHDGQPGTIIEALSMGRHFIFSQDFPFCKKATNFEELKRRLDELLADPSLNVEGSEYVNEYYSISKIVKGLEKIYSSV